MVECFSYKEDVVVRFHQEVPNNAQVAQLEEVAVLETVCCGFDSHSEYQIKVNMKIKQIFCRHLYTHFYGNKNGKVGKVCIKCKKFKAY